MVVWEIVLMFACYYYNHVRQACQNFTCNLSSHHYKKNNLPKTIGCRQTLISYRGNSLLLVFMLLSVIIRCLVEQRFFIYFIVTARMAISKEKKVQLHKAYIEQLNNAGNVAIFSQSGLTVNESNRLRKLIKREGWLLQVTKKRLFVRAVAETDFDAVKFEDLNGAIWVVYTNPDNTFGPIKTVSQFLKEAKKEKKLYTIEFQGGWMQKKWLDSTTMTEVANLPSKEELIGKTMFLFKYPVQSFAMVLDQIAKKKEESAE